MSIQHETTALDERIDEDSQNEDLDLEDASPLAADTCFHPREIPVIRALLTLAPAASSKESKRLHNAINITSVEQIYAKILKLRRATNKELVHYLGVMLRFPHDTINLDDLVDMKFTAQEKHLNQLLFVYFSLVEHYYSDMTYEQRLRVFFRYVFLFSSGIPLDISIYSLFAEILSRDFLGYFISRKCFTGFPFVKNLIVDFAAKAPDSIVKIGYEMPAFRQLAYVCCAPPASTVCPTDWVVRRWGIQAHESIPALFYHYDCTMFLEQLALERFQSLEDPLAAIKQDLKGTATCSVCASGADIGPRVARHFALARELEERVHEFNASASVVHPLTIDIIRLLPGVDLRALGSFLCKERNLPHLVKFAETFDFVGMNLLEALRVFLSSFAMGGESQVIDRVMSVYADEFCRQNLKNPGDRFERTSEICKRITYGFIVLNTMIFNPTTEKRLTFEDFLKQLRYNDTEFTNDENPSLSFDIEELRSFYDSVQENELKMPLVWADGYDKFQLFKRQLVTVDCGFVSGGDEICDSCTILCYRHLFRECSRSLMFLQPEPYFEMVRILDYKPEFEKYMEFHRKDTARFLESARLYLEAVAADKAFIGTLLDALEKTERPRGSMLPDLKSMFSKASLTDMREKPFPTVGQFVPAVQSLLKIRFASEEICEANCELLGLLSDTRRSYIKKICQKIIVNNSAMISRLSQYNEDLQLRILCENAGTNLSDASSSAKIKFLHMELVKGNFTQAYHDVFWSVGVCDQESFDVFCLLQSRYNDFDQIINVIRTAGDRPGPRFSYAEACPEVLNHTSNVMKLFTSTNSLLNIKIAKRIHRDTCPVNDAIFNEFDKVVYLILKCDRKERSLVEYASCIINYLSDSLTLLVNLYEEVFPLFHQISSEMSGILVKILTKRIRIFIDSGVSCCDETKDPNTVFKLKHLISALSEISLISETEIKGFGSNVGRQDIVEL